MFHRLVILTLLIVLTSCSLVDPNESPFQYDVNSHFYEIIDTPMTFSQAKELVLTKTYNNMQGYLLTLESKLEMDWVMTKFPGVEKRWLGAEMGVNYTWTWKEGSTKNQVFYDALNGDRCYRFCGDMVGSFDSSVTAMTLADGHWETAIGETTAMVIVEYGSVEQPKISQVSEYESLVTITDLSFAPTGIVFNSTTAGASNCTDIQETSTNTYTCKLAAGVSGQPGLFSVYIEGPAETATVVMDNYSFASPFIMTIKSYIKDNAPVVQISGTNLAAITASPSTLVFTIGGRVVNSCVDQRAIDKRTEYPTYLECSIKPVDPASPTPLSKVTIVDSTVGISLVQTRVPIQGPDGLLYVYSSLTASQSEVNRLSGLMNLMNSEIGAVDFANSLEVSEFLKSNLIVSSSSLVWSGASRSSSEVGSIDYNSNPINLIPEITLEDGEGPLTYNFDTKTLASADASQKLPWVVVFGILNPIVDYSLQVAVSPSTPLTGFSVPMLKNFGLLTVNQYNADFTSTYSVESSPSVAGTGKIRPNPSGQSIIVSGLNPPILPSLSSINLTISVPSSDENLPATSIRIFSYTLKYLQYFQDTPDIITVIGTNFVTGASQLTGIPCVGEAVFTSTQAFCTFNTSAPEMDSYDITVTSLGQTANITWSSVFPVVESIVPSLITLDGGSIVITGKRLNGSIVFGNNISCDNISLDSDTQVTCTLPPTNQTTLINQITINSTISLRPSNAQLQYIGMDINHTLSTQDGLLYTLNGNFDLYCWGLTMALNDLEIDLANATCTPTQLTFNLTTDCHSGSLFVANNRPYMITLPITLNPVIFNLSSGVTLDPYVDTIINGAFFNETSLVKIGSVNITNTQFINRESITIRPPPMTGNHELYIQLPIGDISSNHINISYPLPIVHSATFENDTIVITGDYFGKDLSVVNITNITPSPLQPTLMNYTSITINLSNDTIPLIRSGNLTVSVADLASNSTPIYTIPVITSVTPSPTKGGLVTLFGSYLSSMSYDSLPILNIDLVDDEMAPKGCVNLLDVEGGVQCSTPSGSGLGHKIQAYNQRANSTSIMDYQSPFILGVSSTYKDTPAQVFLSGTNFAATGLNVTIGGLLCTDPKVFNFISITCMFESNITIASNETSLNVQVYVDGQSHSSYSFIYNRPLIKPCMNGCSEHGTCHDGTCTCEAEWNGAMDCSKKILKEKPAEKPTEVIKPPVIVEKKLQTVVGSESTVKTEGNRFKEVKFDIGITHLREIAPDDTVVKQLLIENIKWLNISGDVPNTLSYCGFWPEMVVGRKFGPILDVNITLFEEATLFDFVGDTIPVLANSVKFNIEVSNWTFSDNLNRLQVIFLTQTDYVEPSDCDRAVSVESDDNVSMRLLEMTKGSTLMRGYFSDRLIVDSRVSLSTVTRLSADDPIAIGYNETAQNRINILTAVTAPHFLRNVIIDPSFGSLLLEENPLSTCRQAVNSWRLPVIIVFTIVGAALLIFGGIYLHRKLGYHTKLISLKLSNLGKRSPVALQWTKQNGGNDHYYELMDTSKTFEQAKFDSRHYSTSVPGTSVQGQVRSYLLTLESGAEDQWVLDNVLNNIDPKPIVWLGATVSYTGYTWSWDTWIDGFPFYDSISDRCYTFCGAGFEGSFNPSLSALLKMNDSTLPWLAVNPTPNLTARYIIEYDYSPIDQPVVSPISDSQSLITIKNMQSQPSSISFTDKDNTVAQCTNPIYTASTNSCTCILSNPTLKVYTTATISANGQSYIISVFASPYISSVSYKVIDNQITISGNNLKDRGGNYEFLVGNYKLQGCSDPSYSSPYMICSTTGAGLSGFHPLSRVTIKGSGNLKWFQTRIPIRAPDGLYYSYINYGFDFYTASRVASMIRLVGIEVGQIAFINSIETGTFIKDNLSPTVSTVWSGAQGFANSGAREVRFNDRTVLVNSSITFTQSTGNYVYDFLSSSLGPSINSLQYPMFIVFGYGAPVADPSRLDPISPTAPYASLLIPMLENFGLGGIDPFITSGNIVSSMSNHTAKIECQVNARAWKIDQITPPITPSTMAPLTITAKTTYSNSTKVLSFTPTFQECCPPKLNIFGTNFSPNTTVISGLSINDCAVLPSAPTTMISCNIANIPDPNHSENYDVTVQSMGTSATTSLDVKWPVVNAADRRNFTFYGGDIIITGKNFKPGTTTTTLIVGGQPCLVDSKSTDTKIISKIPFKVEPFQDQVITSIKINGYEANYKNLTIHYIEYKVDLDSIVNVGSIYSFNVSDLGRESYPMSDLAFKIGAFDAIQIDSTPPTITFNISNENYSTQSSFVIMPDKPWKITLPIKLKPILLDTTIVDMRPNTTSSINGYFFGTEAALAFGDSPTWIDPIDVSTRLIAFFPPQLVGTVPIIVNNQDGNSSMLVTASYAAPSIFGITITNQEITITGDLFGPTSTSVIVSGITQSPLTLSTNTYNEIKIPITDSYANTIGSGLLTVTTGGKTSNTWLTLLTPVISHVSTAPVTGGYITLTGQFLTIVSPGDTYYSVKVGGNICNQLETIEGGGGVRCIVPAGSGKGHQIILVFNGKDTIIIPTLDYQAPHITGVSSTYLGAPGVVSIYGSNFADSGIYVTIEGQDCPIKTIQSTTITCQFASNISMPAGQTSLNVSVVVNQQSFSSYSFIYLRQNRTCLNNCTSIDHGKCVDGACKCEDIWNGALDCSVKVADDIHTTPPIVNPTAPVSTIGTESDDNIVSFDIGVSHLREITTNGTEVTVLAIKNIVWTNTSSSIDGHFISYRGSFPSGPIVIVNVTVFLNESSYNFAGDTFKVLANSVKYQIQVSNWTFSSPLNSLQVIFLTQTAYVKPSECDRGISVTSDNDRESLRFLQITQGSAAMRGLYSDRLLVDSRAARSAITQLPTTDSIVTSLFNQSMSNVLTAVTSPNFLSNVIIDPSFGSLLVVAPPLDTCDQSSGNSQKWKLPTIIVASIIGAACIITLSVLLIKKKLGYRTKLISLKLRNLTKRNKLKISITCARKAHLEKIKIPDGSRFGFSWPKATTSVASLISQLEQRGAHTNKRHYIYLYPYRFDAQTPIAQFTWPTNNHTYKLFALQKTLDEAKDYVANLTLTEGTPKGYLWTIESKAEESAVIAAFASNLATDSVWIGAERTDLTWSWIDGQTGGEMFYDTTSDRCFRYCNAFEGSFDDSLTGITVNVDKVWGLVDQAATAYVIVEYGGVEEPRVQQISEYQTSLVIYSIPFIPTSLTFVSDQMPTSWPQQRREASCSGFTRITPTSYNCTIDFRVAFSSVGTFTVLIKGIEVGQVITITNYMFASPFLMAIRPQGGANTKDVLIVGGNLDSLFFGPQQTGNRFAALKIGSINSSNCKPPGTVSALRDFPRPLICTFPDPVYNVMLSKIEIVSDTYSINIRQSRLPVQNNVDKLLYVYLPSLTLSAAFRISVSTSFFGLEYGYPALISSSQIGDFITRSVTTAPSYWTGAKTLGQDTTSVSYLGVSEAIQSPVVITASADPGTYIYTAATKTLSVASDSEPLGCVVVYGRLAPIVDMDRFVPLPINQDYTSLHVPMTANFGLFKLLPSNYKADFADGTISTNISCRPLLKLITIENTTQTPSTSPVKVTIFLTDNADIVRPFTFVPKFVAPTITVFTYIPTSNSLIVNGTNFNTNPLNPSTISGTNGFTCTPVVIQPTWIECPNAPVGAFDITVTSLDMQFTKTWFSPTTPAIDSIHPTIFPLTSTGSIITISGQSFPNERLTTGTEITLQSASVDVNIKCTLTQVSTDTTIVCKLAAQTDTVNITVVQVKMRTATVVQLKNDIVIYHYKPIIESGIQNNLAYTFNGQHFDLYCSMDSNNAAVPTNGLTVTLDDKLMTITHCTPTNITFALTQESTSGTAILFNGKTYKFSQSVELTPILDEITSILDPAVKVTLTGYFFSANTVVQVDRSSVTTNFISPSKITFMPPQKVGEVEINASGSNKVKASYMGPVITSLSTTVSQDNSTTIVSITGNYFGNTDSVKVYGLAAAPITIAVPAVTYTLVVVTVPRRTLRSGIVYVTVGSIESNKKSLILAPTDIIVPAIPVTGGMVTVVGAYLYKNSFSGDVVNTFQFDDTTINVEDLSGLGIRFIAPPGTGATHKLVITEAINQEYIVSKDIGYQLPHISGSSSTYFGKQDVVTISGSGFAQKGLVVTIGGQECTDQIAIRSTLITCTFKSTIILAPDETAMVTVKVDQQSHSYLAFIYYRQDKPGCPNGCFQNQTQGVCGDNGECICKSDWNGALDCSVMLLSNNGGITPPVIKENTTDSTLGSENDKYANGITHLREITPNGDIVLTLKLADIVWFNNTPATTETNTTSLVGSFPTYPDLVVAVNMTIFYNDSSYNFAGDSFPVYNNTVKYQIEVTRWPFNSNLNSLQVIFLTQTGVALECDRDVSVTSDDAEYMRFLEVTKGSTKMRGRFSDRLIVDNRITMSSVKRLPTNDEIFRESNLTMTNVYTAITSPTKCTITTTSFVEAAGIDGNVSNISQSIIWVNVVPLVSSVSPSVVSLESNLVTLIGKRFPRTTGDIAFSPSTI
eukprot:gene4119-4809_t